MSHPKSASNNTSSDGNAKRRLPSWTARPGKGDAVSGGSDEDRGNGSIGEEKKKGKDLQKAKPHGDGNASEASPHKDIPFSRLMEGVVFALSGFVNPERGALRSQALEMGAEFKPDWSPDCTLLVCAFRNTPKFRLVEDDGGTIVSKEWIMECHSKKKLMEIDPYLMHAGKPWRKPVDSIWARQEHVQHRNAQERVTKASPELALPKDTYAIEDIFPPPELKKWAMNDLKETVSWLEGQDEKPEPHEIKKIAAEGIITCLQDAVEALENNEDIRQMMDKWMFIPRVVEELAKLEAGEKKKKPLAKKELIRLAIYCKGIYTNGLSNIDISPTNKKSRASSSIEVQDRAGVDDPGYDSDATIVMTEEEIEQAFRG